MSPPSRRIRPFLLAALLLCGSAPAAAQVPDGNESNPTLGSLIRRSSKILVLEVEKTTRQPPAIHFKKVADLHGGYPAKKIVYGLGEKLTPDAEPFLEWAAPGETAVVFQYLDDAVHICFGNVWRRARVEEDPTRWQADLALDQRLTYFGSTIKLRKHVADILAGKEVVITQAAPAVELSFENDAFPRREDGSPASEPVDWVWGKRRPVLRSRASLKIDATTESEASPHFVGFGAGDADIVPDLRKGVRSKRSRERAAAAEDLGRLGTIARPALEDLRKALTDAEQPVCVNAAEALRRIDPDDRTALPVLVKSLKDDAPQRRQTTAMILASLGELAVEGLPELALRLEKDPDVHVRRAVGNAIRNIVGDCPERRLAAQAVVPALGRVLRNDADQGVRLWAVRALLKCGPAVRSARPALAFALRDKNESVAGVAAITLARLGAKSVPLIEKELLLAEWGPVTLRDLFFEIRELGPRRRGLAPAIVGRLMEMDAEFIGVRIEGLMALERLDPEIAHRVAADVMRRSISADNLYFQLGVEDYSLLRFPSVWPLLVAERIKLLRHEKPEFRLVAARRLGRLGDAARPAVPLLREMLKHEDRHMRMAAAQALWLIEQPIDEQVLLLLLESKYPDELPMPALARNLAPKARELRPLLERALASPDANIRHTACGVLALIGPEARAALPAVRRRLKDDEFPVRLAAAMAVLRFHPADADALPVARTVPKEREARGKAAALLLVLDQKIALREAMPLLMEVARDDEGGYVTSDMIGTLGDLGETSVPLLKAMMTKTGNPKYSSAAFALYRIRKDHGPILQMLKKEPARSLYGYADLDEPARREIAAVATPWLLREIRREDPERSQEAWQALRHLNPEAAAKAAAPREEGALPWENLGEKQLESLWNDLGDEGQARAYRAVWMLALARTPAVNLCKARLQPVSKDVPERIAARVAQLDDGDFQQRRDSFEALKKLGLAAEPALRQGLARRPSLEATTQIDRLLERLDPETDVDIRRRLRAIEALEYCEAAEAQSLLESLAGGATESLITRAAKKSLALKQQWAKYRPMAK